VKPIGDWRGCSLANDDMKKHWRLPKQGLVIDPGAKDLLNTLGGIYIDLGRHEKQLLCIAVMSSLDPRNLMRMTVRLWPISGGSIPGKQSRNTSERWRLIGFCNSFGPSGQYVFSNKDATRKRQSNTTLLSMAFSNSDRARAWHRHIGCLLEREKTGRDRASCKRGKMKYSKMGLAI